MGEIALERIVFSEQVQAEWPDASLWQRLLRGERQRNPAVMLQVSPD